MSKKNIIINIFILIITILSSNESNDYINRHDNYKEYYDCLDKSDKPGDIKSADDCFKKSPIRKWKCCYFEFDEGKGCMKVRKNNETDLNDLKDFVSGLSMDAVFTCKQNYLIYSFGLFILLLFFF